MARPVHWTDRVAGFLSPTWQLQRMQARAVIEVVARHYEAASTGRRTQGWRKSVGDANAVIGAALAPLRDAARDLVRNNGYAESAVSTIADHTVGWGIKAKPREANRQILDEWDRWAESTDCDADGRHDFYGLQKLVMRSVVEGGEVLIRRRVRRVSDGFRVPFQIQVLDADFIDTLRDSTSFLSGVALPRTIQGVQFDPIGRRTGYWLFREHPGSALGAGMQSALVPASQILHAFKATRTGQVRAPSWFAQVLLKFKDFDEFEDATLMKQKIAACLAAFITDTSGYSATIGVPAATTESPSDTAMPELDMLGPGAVITTPPGRDVKIVEPPSATDYDPYSKTVLRAIATGLGVTYEDLTGDYANMPFSAARMSRLRHEARVYDWRYRILIPQFCDPVWRWFIQAAVLAGRVPESVLEARAEWTPPPLPMVDPVSEGLAAQRNIRTGISSWSEEARARGYDPEDLAEEIADDFARFDRLGITLDCDPRKMTQAGQAQSALTPEQTAEDAAAADRALSVARGGRQ